VCSCSFYQEPRRVASELLQQRFTTTIHDQQVHEAQFVIQIGEKLGHKKIAIEILFICFVVLLLSVIVLPPLIETGGARQGFKRTLWTNRSTGIPPEFLYAAFSMDNDSVNRLILINQSEYSSSERTFNVYMQDGTEAALPRSIFVYDPAGVPNSQSQIDNYNSVLIEWGRDTMAKSVQINRDNDADLVSLFVELKTGDVEQYNYEISATGPNPVAWYIIE
jgi:hypothetical protein